METGEQAVMGEVRVQQDIVKSHIMENLPRFKPGDPYNAWIMERFRIDVWRTGYFNNIEIVEDRHLDESPPRVDLDITLEPRKRNTYQGSIGIGSDTGARVQFSWNRHLISRNGDSFSLGTGWQERLPGARNLITRAAAVRHTEILLEDMARIDASRQEIDRNLNIGLVMAVLFEGLIDHAEEDQNRRQAETA